MSTEDAVEIRKCFDDWIASSDRCLDESFHDFANDAAIETPPDAVRTHEPWPSRPRTEPFIVEDDEPLSLNVDRKRPRDIKAVPASPSPTLRRKKKPKSLPKRPLSAYNFFFQQERNTLMQDKTQFGFQDLGKMVGKNWKNLPEAERGRYNLLANEDNERYRREMKEYKEREKNKLKEDSLLDDQPTHKLVSLDQHDSNNNENPHVAATNHPLPAHVELHLTAPAPVPPLPLHPEQPMLTFPPVHSGSYPPYASPYGTYYAPYGPYAAPHCGLHPLPPGVMLGPVPPSGFPLIPQQEVLLPTHSGHFRKYKIQYAVMTMTEAAAKEYMQQWHHIVGPPACPGPAMDGGNAAVSPPPRSY